MSTEGERSEDELNHEPSSKRSRLLEVKKEEQDEEEDDELQEHMEDLMVPKAEHDEPEVNAIWVCNTEEEDPLNVDHSHQTNSPPKISPKVEMDDVADLIEVIDEAPDSQLTQIAELAENSSTAEYSKYEIDENETTVSSKQPDDSDDTTVSSKQADDSDTCCVIDRLLEKRFTSDYWKTRDRRKIVMDGRPRPQFENECSSYYSAFLWLSGCVKLKKLVCWNCLLFSNKGVWSIGYENPNVMGEAGEHQQSVIHLDARSSYIQARSSFANWTANQESLKKSLISQLIKNPFLQDKWTPEEREEIVLKGRPRPSMEILMNDPKIAAKRVTPDTQHQLGNFLRYYFSNMPWLTGCTLQNKAYCWPCLLFSEKGWQYSNLLDSDSAKLSMACKLHESQSEHLEASLQLKVMEFEVKEKHKIKTAAKCKTVKDNRWFLKRLAIIICSLKKKLTNSIVSSEDYLNVLKLMSSHDPKLKAYLSIRSAECSENTPENLVAAYCRHVESSIEHVINSQVRSEVRSEAKYITLILDATSSELHNTMLFTILRYVDERGEIQERLVSCVPTSKFVGNQSVSNLANHVSRIISVGFNIKKKIVAFTYDGAIIKPSEILSFNDQMTSLCPSARFFHYQGHNLKILLNQVLSQQKPCRDFFRNIWELANFFINKKNMASTLIEFEVTMNGGSRKNVWDFSTGFVTTLRHNYVVFIKFFENIVQCPSEWKTKTVVMAQNFLAFLRSIQSKFLLILIARIFSEVEGLLTVMEEGDAAQIDIMKHAVQRAFAAINPDFDYIIAIAQTATLHGVSKSYLNPAKLKILKMWCDQIVASAYMFIEQRTLLNTTDFHIARALLSKDPKTHTNRPDFEVLDTLAHFKSTFNLEHLKLELGFFHSSSFFDVNKESIPVTMEKYNLRNVLAELDKFLRYIFAIPINTTADSAIKRMSSYIKHNRNVTGTNALFWMEKDLITSLQESDQFYENLIKHFTLSAGKDDFIMPTTQINNY